MGCLWSVDTVSPAGWFSQHGIAKGSILAPTPPKMCKLHTQSPLIPAKDLPQDGILGFIWSMCGKIGLYKA